TEIKVRYAETDQMGVVYYANYLVWFEVARTSYFSAHGMEYTEIEKEGLGLAVVEAHCVYRAPARYGDTVIVEVWPSDVKASSLKFCYKIYRKNDRVLLTEGFTMHVLIDKTFRPRKIPEKIRTILTGC
ncbi:MAG: thioesterase family protein, partial [Candidatus Omnitrophota bacterium]